MSWMGQQTALNILGRQNRPPAFQDRPFPTAIGYRDRTWFLPLVSAGYHLRDFMDRPIAVMRERLSRKPAWPRHTGGRDVFSSLSPLRSPAHDRDRFGDRTGNAESATIHRKG